MARHSIVPLSRSPRVVGALSTRTTSDLCTGPLVFPQASTACQVLVRVYDPPHPVVELSLLSTLEELMHESLEVGVVNTGVAGHSTVQLSLLPPIVGCALCSTMMV